MSGMNMTSKGLFVAVLGGWITTTIWSGSLLGEEKGLTDSQLLALPGGTKSPLGHLELGSFDAGAGSECEKGIIVVPENRQAETTRNIELHFYRFKAHQPSERAPVFVLPGGPGGYFDDRIARALSAQFNDPDSSAAVFVRNRDVILMNQRGARFPDRRYQFFGFLIQPAPYDEPFSPDAYAESVRSTARNTIASWTKRGVDVAGYDIMNMVEDIDAVRTALGYKQIVLRGTSFGSQWSFSYMQAHPEHVQRAVLGGTEPIDYGYDSPQGVWNVFKRLEQRLEDASGPDNSLNLPEVSLTEAIKQIVARLREAPVQVELGHPQSGDKRTVHLGVDDFRRQLRSGIRAQRESTQSLENFPKYIFEIFDEDYRYLATKVMQSRSGFNGASLQALSIDNSLGISAARDKQLDDEQPREWVGELNLTYKATRDVTPSPVVQDSFRVLSTDIPILLVHGDLDLSTPIENAEAAMATLSNAHLIRIFGGTHGAFDQIANQSSEFRDLVARFLDADFGAGVTEVASLGLPRQLHLEELGFAPIGGASLFDEVGRD